MANFLTEIQRSLLENVLEQSPNAKKFRADHASLRDEIRRLAAMQVFVEKEGRYVATFGGIMLAESAKAKQIQAHFRVLYESLRARFRVDPNAPVTTAEIAAELGINKPQVNYLFKLAVDHTGPSLLGGGNYSDGEGDSRVEIAEEILDYDSFDQIMSRAEAIAKERTGSYPPLPGTSAKEMFASAGVEPQKSEPPKVPEKWRWRGKFAEGGQAEAFYVVDPQGRQFVGKRIKNLSRIDRFKKEISALETVRHTNVVKIVDSDLSAAKPYIVMEHCVGRDLESNRFWVGNPYVKFQLMRQILNGVAAAHKARVIHRDIKPSNILLREPAGVPVIADFGICFLKDYASEKERDTGTLEVMGARWFLAPEYETGFVDSPEPTGDVYSLGKLFYWLMSDGGILPREMFREKIHNLVTIHDDPRYEHVNIFLDQVVVHDVSKRIQTVEEMKGGLALIEKQFETHANFPETELTQRCIYCGVGEYKLTVSNLTQAGNFGFVKVGNPNWRVLVCDRCGNTQIFRKDLI